MPATRTRGKSARINAAGSRCSRQPGRASLQAAFRPTPPLRPASARAFWPPPLPRPKSRKFSDTARFQTAIPTLPPARPPAPPPRRTARGRLKLPARRSTTPPRPLPPNGGFPPPDSAADTPPPPPAMRPAARKQTAPHRRTTARRPAPCAHANARPARAWRRKTARLSSLRPTGNWGSGLKAGVWAWFRVRVAVGWDGRFGAFHQRLKNVLPTDARTRDAV